MGRRGPSLAPVELTGAQRRQLTRVAADESDAAMAGRARLVLLAAEGASNTEIADAVGLNATSVGRWRARFVAEGVAGLVDQRHVPAGRRAGRWPRSS